MSYGNVRFPPPRGRRTGAPVAIAPQYLKLFAAHSYLLYLLSTIPFRLWTHYRFYLHIDFLIIAIASFTIHDPCSSVGDYVLKEKNVKLDFDIYYNASVEELLDIKEELDRLSIEKAGRDFADTTIAL